MKVLLLLVLVAAAAQGQNKAQKAFSLFNVVSFKNDACQSTENIANSVMGGSKRMGNCVSSSECSDQKGEASGSCAAGFGVCCVFTLNDDDETSFTVNKNNTYLQNPNFPAMTTEIETYTFELEKQDKDICAIRLDFESFTIASPADEIAATGGCSDTFEITAISSDVTIPVVCGTLTGQHMYLYLGNDNEGDSATAKLTLDAANTEGRQWDIKVAQIECTSDYLPAAGCLQYHMEASGVIKTFNFDEGPAGSHLPNQNYQVCLRRSAGFCCVQYQACQGEDQAFTVGAPTTDSAAQAQNGVVCTEDFIGIEGGSQDGSIPTQHRYCGSFLNPNLAATGHFPVTTCSSYELSVFTDAVDDNEAFAAPDVSRGACIEYRLLPC